MRIKLFCLCLLIMCAQSITLAQVLSKNENSIILKRNEKYLKVEVITPSIFHFMVSSENKFENKSLVVVGHFDIPKINYLVGKSKISLQSENYRTVIDLNSEEINCTDKTGKLIIQISSSSLRKTKNDELETKNVEQNFLITANEGLYGLGQFQDGIMNYRNQEIYLAQANRIAVNPFLVSTNGYGILWDNYSKSIFKEKNCKMSFWSEAADQIDFYLILGKSIDEIIKGYRDLTGRAPLYPKWAYGYFQSKERYKSQSELIQIAKEFRDRKFPIDVIVQDWAYWGNGPQFSGMIWDPKFYPSPEKLIDTLHNIYHVKLMNSIWPAIGMETDLYKELTSNGFTYSKPHWSGGRLYDAYNLKAREIYWKYLNKGLFSKGVDAFWMDGSEPEMNSSADSYITESEIKQLGKNFLGSYSEYLNPYSLVHTQGVYEGQRSVTNNKRVYILTRSVFTGQQRYGATTWSGDIGANWNVLRNQISAGINFCMSGVPYWTSDIGGFLLNSQGGMYPEGGKDPAYQELYVRWFQFGSFCPIFRSHGTNYPREPWQFGDENSENYKSLLKFTNLRYLLMPYIYSLGWMVTNDGYTMMRGLPMDFASDRKTFSIDNQYMFGPSLLICPLTIPTKYITKKKEDFIPSQNLFGKSREPGYWDLSYFIEQDYSKPVFRTKMVEMSIGWMGQVPEILKNKSYSINWEGYVKTIKQKGIYSFVINTNGGVKIWIDDKLKLDESRNSDDHKFVIEEYLKPNRYYKILVQHYQPKPNQTNIKLEWITPNSSENKLADSQKIYLPAGTGWYDFWTGEKFDGGKNISRKIPLDEMPIYVKEGSILPLGAFIQYANEKKDEPIELRIYPGRDCTFTLYEDEGDNFNYEKGKYATMKVSWNDKGKELTLGKLNGEFDGIIKKRIFKIIMVSRAKGVGIGVGDYPSKEIHYSGDELSIKLN